MSQQKTVEHTIPSTTRTHDPPHTVAVLIIYEPVQGGTYARRATHHFYVRNREERIRSASQPIPNALLRAKQHMAGTRWKLQLNGKFVKQFIVHELQVLGFEWFWGWNVVIEYDI